MINTLASSIALSAATFFLGACDKSGGTVDPASAGADDLVKCQGVNTCEGQSECGVKGSHGCAGKNECKGKGWVKVSKADCDTQGGAAT
ncbi:MAG: hypothetical protein V3V08_16405 [Nannocystaceae bacterium]